MNNSLMQIKQHIADPVIIFLPKKKTVVKTARAWSNDDDIYAT